MSSASLREDFWIQDGDLMLDVEHCRFKIRRADLYCSEVFRDMFELSESMQPPEEECVDGVPLLKLPQDKAKDWMLLLWWIYDYT